MFFSYAHPGSGKRFLFIYTIIKHLPFEPILHRLQTIKKKKQVPDFDTSNRIIDEGLQK